MNINPVVLSIPIFFLFIGIEILVERIMHRKTYRLADSISNISCGIMQQLIGLFLKILTIGVYQFLFERYAIFSLERSSPWYWISLLLLVDLAYYFGHRISHGVNLFWAGHIVHHQSEEFNLSVALRQSSFSIIWFFWFNLPIALLGFETLDFALITAINTLYQFWIHTELVNKLGIFEHFMNTPSHHRVHHGRDPKYVDKNHGGMFIIWDKLFGTFQAEEEKPTYGITKPIRSWNAIYANFSHYVEIERQLNRISGWSDRLKYLFKKPGWLPDYLGGRESVPNIDQNAGKKYNTFSTQSLDLYVLFQFTLTTIATVVFLNVQERYSSGEKAFVIFLISFTIANCCVLFENKKWVQRAELVRIISYPIVLTVLAFIHSWATWVHITAALYLTISTTWFLSFKRSFQTKG